jgi:hypothetical protein
LSLSRVAAGDPAHRRTLAQAFGVVPVIISGEAPEKGLPKQPDRGMAAVCGKSQRHPANAG